MKSNDATMDGINVAIEAISFSEHAAEYLRKLLPEDQQCFVDAVTSTAFLGFLAAGEARDAYSGSKSELDAENNIHDDFRELNEWREKFGMLKGAKEKDDGRRICKTNSGD